MKIVQFYDHFLLPGVAVLVVVMVFNICSSLLLTLLTPLVTQDFEVIVDDMSL